MQSVDLGRTGLRVSKLCFGTLTMSPLQKNLSRYITQWRKEKTDVSGEDLRIMGLEPGPAFGRILDAVLAAKLDGTAATPEQQMDLARSLVCSIGAKSGNGNEEQTSRNSSLAQRL